MAIRRYISNAAVPAGVTMPAPSGWGVVGTADGSALSVTPSGAGGTSSASDTSATSPWTGLFRRFVSDQMLSEGDLQGNWQAVFGVQESSLSADMFLRIVVRVVSADGSVSRGSRVFVDGTEFPTAATGRAFSGVISPAIPCQVGDRLVLEIGFQATNAVATSYTGAIRRGGTGTPDLAAGDGATEVGLRPGWFQLDDPSADARWAAAPDNVAEVWNGTAWIDADISLFDGSAWQAATAEIIT